MNENHFTIKLADHIIEITASPHTYNLCSDYLWSGKPDFRIQVSNEEIKREIDDTKSLYLKRGEIDSLEYKKNGHRIYIQKTDDTYLKTVAVYRKIVDQLIDYKYILMHGSVIAIKNEAFMFSAPSGTGKTTHIRQWLQRADGAFVVNGDKPLIKISATRAIACGTPWCGKEHLGTNIMVPLKAIVFMERNENNSIEEISFSQAYPFLLQHSHIPYDTDKARTSLNLISQLDEKVSFWHFRCNNFKDDCFYIAYNALVGEKHAKS